MKRERIFQRCILLLADLLIMAFGVALSARSELGTSPISSLPYVLSLGLPLPIGQFTILQHIGFILIQILLLRKNFQPIQLLQLAAVICFGAFTDGAMYLLRWFQPSFYWQQWAGVLVGCVLVGIGVSFEIRASLITLAGDGLVKVISQVFYIDFGKTKICFDCVLVALAIICSLLLFHTMRGVGEGTVAAAVLVGTIARFAGKRLPQP